MIKSMENLGQLNSESLLDAAVVATDKVRLGDEATWLGRKHGLGIFDDQFVVGQRYPVVHIYHSNFDIELQGAESEVTTRATATEYAVGE